MIRTTRTKAEIDTKIDHTALLELNEAICIINKRSRILFANKSFELVFGKSAGRSFNSICKNADPKKQKLALPDRKVEYELETKFPKRAFLRIHTPIKIGKQTLFMQELKDMTSLKKREQTLADYTSKLEKEVRRKTFDLRKKIAESEDERSALLNMMDELNNAYNALEEEAIKKDELFDITSHELKTPLVPISGFAELLLTNADNLTKDQKEQLKMIKDNVFRLKNLLENIIDIAKLQAKQEDFDINTADLASLTGSAVEEMVHFAKEKNIKISKELPKSLKIRCDSDKITRVLRHLINNAIKFNNKNGKVKIIIKKTNKYATITVTNTGRGIPSKFKEKVFEKFFQVDSSLDREFGGTGLGLPICRMIIEAHDGEIWFDSQQGKGTAFYVRIPIALRSVRKNKKDIYHSNVNLLVKARKKLEEEKMDLMTQI